MGIIFLSIESMGLRHFLITNLLSLIWETEKLFSPPMYLKGICPNDKPAGFLLSKYVVNRRFSNVKCSLSSVQICSLTLQGPKRLWLSTVSNNQTVNSICSSHKNDKTLHGSARGLRLYLRGFLKGIHFHNINMLIFFFFSTSKNQS